MFKRPVIRHHEHSRNTRDMTQIKPDTFLYNIIKPKPTVFSDHVTMPIFQKEAYLRLLEKNNIELGIPFNKPIIPDSPIYKCKEAKYVNYNYDWDRVYIKLRFMKNGTIRLKCITSFKHMYDTYCVNAKKPPIKTIINAYKDMGMSKEFTDKLQANHMKNIKLSSSVFKRVDALLTKEPIKKPKKKKEEISLEEDEITETIDDKDDDEDDDRPNDDDGGMDMEIDQDEDDLGNVDEEYFSDVE